MDVLQFIEIDLKRCSLFYGVSPCAAEVGVTGAAKCFNSVKTCQDSANFAEEIVTLRFAVPTDDLPKGVDCYPAIRAINFDSGQISLGENLGQRAALTVTFSDFPDSDTGAAGDKYRAERGYDAYLQGTFFGKLRARQPYIVNQPLRWIVGRVGQAIEDMEVHHFIVDSFGGPSIAGEFRIVAKDPLKLADDNKALAPRASNGFLIADIDEDDTAATLSPAGIGDVEYDASEYIAIGGSEICRFTRSGDSLTLTRAQLGTSARAHKAQDRCQVVIVYAGESPANIIHDLLTNYANVPDVWVPLTAWQEEIATYLNRNYSAVIAQPTAVKTLVSELVEQAGLSIWWDDLNESIGLSVLRGRLASAQALSDENVVQGSLTIGEQPDKRLSQVHTYFGQINPLTSLTDKANYRSVAISINHDAEANYGSAAIKEIFSRWIPALGRTVADRLNTIKLGRFSDPPRHIKLQVLRGSVSTLALARSYNVFSGPIQDATGAPSSLQIQLTRLSPMADLISVEGDEDLFTAPPEDLSNRQIIVDGSIKNIDLRATHDILYPAPEDDDDFTLTVTILEGVGVGSTTTSLPAIDIGDTSSWPAGITINVVNRGRLQGRGGRGAVGGSPASYNGSNGEGGGTALKTRRPINLVNDGEISGGGGGGGGGGSSVEQYPGAPGAGGAGDDPGVAAAWVQIIVAAATDGSLTHGGVGGKGYYYYFAQFGGDGGNGGDRGQPGDPGKVGSSGQPGSGGPAGAAIDGISFVSLTNTGTILGPQVN